MTPLDYLDRIEQALTIPAAEYVPAIGDVFEIIREARRAALPVAPSDEQVRAVLALAIKHGDFRFAHGQCHARGERIEAELNFDFGQAALKELRTRLLRHSEGKE